MGSNNVSLGRTTCRVCGMLESDSARLLAELSDAAWSIRERAFTFGGTKVGCAVRSSSGAVYVGCNVEHRFRSHDVHAEVNAITSMVSNGEAEFLAILIAAEREFFTPCGACMDWVMQFGACAVVGFQSCPNGPITTYTASQLMPYYPR